METKDNNQRLPEYLVVGPYTYKINYVDNINFVIDPNGISDSQKDGFTVHHKQQIYISTDMYHDMMSDTLLHEMMHVILRAIAAYDDDDEEEELVSRVTPILLQVIRDNPELIDFICRRRDI